LEIILEYTLAKEMVIDKVLKVKINRDAKSVKISSNALFSPKN